MKHFILIIIVFPFFLSVQNATIDSLKSAFKNAKHDTTKCNVLEYLISLEEENEPWLAYNIELKKIAEKNISHSDLNTQKLFLRFLADALYNIAYLDDEYGNSKEALNKNLRALKIYEALNRKKDMCPTLNSIGSIYSRAGNIDKALEFYEQALKISREIEDDKAVSYCLNNIAYIYDSQGFVAKAIDYYYKALKTNEQNRDSISLATVLSNIGMIYKTQGDVPKALENFERAITIQKLINDKRGMGVSLNNIGLVYSIRGDNDKSLFYNLEALKIRQEINDVRGIASSLGNIGAVYKNMGDLPKALDNLKQSLVIREKIKDQRGIALCLNGMANVLVLQEKVSEGFSLAKRSFKLSNEINQPDLVQKSAQTLKNIYESQGKYQQALEMFEVYNQMRDSIQNSENKQISIKKQFQYQYEKKAAADSVKHTEEQKVKNALLTAQQAQLTQEKTQRLALYVGLVLVIAFLVFVFNRFRVIKKQKVIIEQQKVLVDNAFVHLEEKNNEVMDSIHYAKRIQTALLTSEKYIERTLNRLSK